MKITVSGLIQVLIFLLMMLLGCASIIFWLHADYTDNIVRFGPGLDNAPEKSASSARDVFGKHHQVFTEKAALYHQKTWPGFRGPERNGISPDKTALAASWGKEGPLRLWEKELGDGHAAAAIYKGYVYLLDYDETRSMDMLRCFTLETGREIWQTGYSNPIKRNHGRSRSIPFVTEDFVVSMGPEGHLMSVRREDGTFLWGKDLKQEFQAEMPLWYTAQCPLVIGNAVLTAICGKEILLAAFDAASGEMLWSIPNQNKYKMSHSSIMPARLSGVDHFVYAALGGILSFTAKGQLLWQESWNPAVIAPSPVQVGPERLYFSAGYGVGSLVLQVSREGSLWKTEKILQRGPTKALSCEQQSPLFYKGRLYAVRPKDAGPQREEFCCADTEGNVLWSSGPLLRFGLGPWIVADNKFLILKDDGELFMADAEADKWQLLDRAKVLDGRDAWGPLAIAGGYLLLRNSRKMICLDLRKESYQ